MPRLRNVETGSIVNVDEATAARLGPVYEPAEEQPKKASAKKPASGKSQK